MCTSVAGRTKLSQMTHLPSPNEEKCINAGKNGLAGIIVAKM